MSNSRIAAILLAVLALVLAGLMVEFYWDCRLLKHGTMQECLPSGAGSGITSRPTLR
jgi:hypothetical protein